MKKRNIFIGSLLLLMLVIVGFMLILNNNMLIKKDNKEVVHTPVRVGKGVASASLPRAYTLKEAIEEADLIVDLTITSWVGENIDMFYTFYSSKVNDCYKGDAPETITLWQLGNSEFTIRDYPLFDVGDRMLLFLRKWVPEEAEKLGQKNAFGMVGEYMGIFDVKSIDNVLYVSDNRGVMTYDKSELKDFNFTEIDYNTQRKFLNQVYLYNTSSQLSSLNYKNFFLYDEWIQVIKKMLGGN